MLRESRVQPAVTRVEPREIAQSWIDGATAAFGQAKRLVRSGLTRDFQDALDDEARTIGAAFATPEASARIAAFGTRPTSR